MKKRSKSNKISLMSMFLGICIISMFFKNTNIYISGTIVNIALILTTLFCGMRYAIVFSIVAPILSLIITGSPIIIAVPLIIPMIMIGNAILCLVVSLFNKEQILILKVFKNANLRLFIYMVVGSILKSAFMGASIAYVILPIFLPVKLQGMMVVAQTTFSLVQLITSLTASIFIAINYRVYKMLRSSNNGDKN